MATEIKVLLLIKGLGLGGAERMIVDSLPYLGGRFKYEVAHMLPSKNFLVPKIQSAGFTVHCLGMKNSYDLPHAVLALHRLVKERRFDIIHAHLPMAGLAARLAGRMNRLPVIYTEHNLQERYHPATRWANKKTMALNAHVISVSGEVTASMTRAGFCNSVPVTTMRNRIPVVAVMEEAADGEHLREELGIPAEHRIVGTVAVFRKQKRLDLWLEVARNVCDHAGKVTFLLAGDGPEAGRLKEEAERLGLGERVIMPGFRPDGRGLIGILDVFLMTSAYEGLPIAVLEAMALGKAIVATDVGGIAEMITEGENGFLAGPGDIELLAKRVCELLGNDSLRLEMGRKAAARAEKDFDLKDNVSQIEDIYDAVISGGYGRRRRDV